MDTIGVVAPTPRVGTTAFVTALADAIATDTGGVTIIDRGTASHATKRYQQNPRNDILFAQTPSATSTTLIDCPPTTHPDCIHVLNTCNVLIVIADPAIETLHALDQLANLIQQSTAVPLAIIITRAKSHKYEPFATLPHPFEQPILSNLLGGTCPVLSNCIALDHAHIEAANTGLYLSELNPPRPDLTNSLLSLNDELDVLRAKASQTAKPTAVLAHESRPAVPATHDQELVRKPDRIEDEPSTPINSVIPIRSRQEFRMSISNSELLDASNHDLADIITLALERIGPQIRARQVAVPQIRAKRIRRTCQLDNNTLAEFGGLANAVDWNRAQLIDALLREHFATADAE